MEETNRVVASQLHSDGVLRDLPYQINIMQYGPASFFVASHYPLTKTHIVYLYGRPLIVQTVVQLPSGPQPLWVVHTIAPLPSSFSQWQARVADHRPAPPGPRTVRSARDRRLQLHVG